MNDSEGNPIYPRLERTPPSRTGITCMRMIPKPRPVYVSDHTNGRSLLITHELCRGEIVCNRHLHCSHCGAVPAWA